MSKEYTAIPLEDSGTETPAAKRPFSIRYAIITAGLVTVTTAVSFALGLVIGHNGSAASSPLSAHSDPSGRLSRQVFIPESMNSLEFSARGNVFANIFVVSAKEMTFRFPTEYEDTGPDGDKLWTDLMPSTSSSITCQDGRC